VLDPEDEEQFSRRTDDAEKNYRVCCDESGMHSGRRLVGHGSFGFLGNVAVISTT
jgi:hypothetical protein